MKGKNEHVVVVSSITSHLEFGLVFAAVLNFLLFSKILVSGVSMDGGETAPRPSFSRSSPHTILDQNQFQNLSRMICKSDLS